MGSTAPGLTRVEMDVEHPPNLQGTADPRVDRLTLALRDRHCELHMPVILAARQDAMDLRKASLVDVDVDEHGNVVNVHINGFRYAT